MLNPNAKKWVAKLRDPNTRQIKGALETSEGQCVLGVPCRLYADEHPEWPVSIYHGRIQFGNVSDWYLPATVWEWLSLRTSTGTHMDANGRVSNLVYLSDNGMSLPDLANLIESEPEGLFV